MKQDVKSVKEGAWQMKFGIKTKFLAAVLAVVLVILTAILSMIYLNTSQMILRQSDTLLKTSAAGVVSRVETWMRQTITALDVERDTLSYFSLDRAQQLDYIKHTANTYDAFPAGIYVATTEGELLHSSFAPGPEFNVFQKSWYKEGLTSDKFVFGSVYFDEDSKSYVVGASGVLKDRSGAVRGVAAADIYLNMISEIVKEVQIEQTGGMFLVDAGSNMIIGHKNAALVGSILDKQDGMYRRVAELMKSKSLGANTYEDADGRQTRLELQAVPGSNWVAIAYVPYEEVVADLTSLTRTMLLIALIGILLLVIFIERTVHVMLRPVKELTRTIAEITRGNFTVDIKAATRDEIGLMAESLRVFISSMRSLIGKIRTFSGKINEQSEDGAQIAALLSNESAAQAKSADEMHRTMNELVRSVAEVASSATALSSIVANAQERGEEAGERMHSTVEEAEQGRRHMDRVSSSMQDITDRINRLEISIQEVGRALSEIDSIVDLIRGIAGETSLLSLNAAIEAARAGESGRGFAVVADQIGKLAATSTGAVQNIANLTEKIRSMVEKTVLETKDSVHSIRENVDTVSGAGDSFDAIFAAVQQADAVVREMIGKIHEVNDIAMSVAGITEEQSAASDEVLAGSERLRQASERVLESSGGMTQDASQLGETSRNLAEQMKQFKI